MGIPSIKIGQSSELPLIGLGTWELRDKKCEEVVRLALDLGYRHLDTAHFYENHTSIRNAIQGFPRNDLIITSKFFIDQLEKQSVEETCDRALNELGLDYLDFYLLHYPDRNAPMEQIVEEMQKLVEKKKIKAMGVCNCTIHHLQDLLDLGLHPSVNQVEFHPYLFQKELWDFCKKQHIQLISYRSLGKGKLAEDPIFETIGKRYGKSPAQASLRWLIQKNIPVIPKASTKMHLEENIDLFDFELNDQDLAILDNMKITQRFCDADWGDFDY